jgi:4-amino-4-deoxy-L-arabinose transferase
MSNRKSADQTYKYILWGLIVVGFIMRLYMAHVDPFLHIWDERFHALVARNMMGHPFTPILRIYPVFAADPTRWTEASVWLHKQPLFMWQMALSMKLFGPTVYALRYPSVLMGTLMIPIIYDTIKKLTNDNLVAIISTALFCFSNFHLELVAGIRSMDHNDIALEFYILVSVWCWIKYEKEQKWYWAILMGVFSGAAILTKWLIGLFVYLIWGTKILLHLKERFNFKEVIRFMASLIVCCLIFLPWQFFIVKHFPIEAAIEYKFNTRHITEALEGHQGTIFFYIQRFPQMFGEVIFLLIFPGIYLWKKSTKKDRSTAIPILIGCLFVFLFFSIVVKTKVISHMYFIAPFLMMFLAYTIVFICTKWLRKNYLIIPLSLGLFVLNAKPEKIIMDQSSEDRKINVLNAQIYRAVADKIPQGAVVVNVPDCISFMFFNKGVTAYETFTADQINDLLNRHIQLTAFDNVDRRPLPDYIKLYPYLTLLHEHLRQ